VINKISILELRNENVIKAGIINNYARRNHVPFIVCSELTISSQNKVADLVFCKEGITTAIEVKASNDDFRKLGEQIPMYCKVFDYVYVALTSNHIEKTNNIPSNVGIISFSDAGKISYLRKAMRNATDANEILFSVPISFIREQLSDGKYSRQSNNLIKPKAAHNVFIAYLHSKCRWTHDDLKDTLHYEDITRNTDYVLL